MKKNFTGLKVLDISTTSAGGYLTLMMRDLGAEIIRIDKTSDGCPYGLERRGKEDMDYAVFNRGKKSVLIDIDTPEGAGAVLALASWADVVVEDAIPGEMADKGLGYEDFKAKNPGVIYVSFSLYGQEGPKSKTGLYDTIAQAQGVLLWVTGEPGGPLEMHGTEVGNYDGAAHALGGIGAALYYRRRNGGEGQHIDISTRDVIVAILEAGYARYPFSGKEDIPYRNGRYNPVMLPYCLYDAGRGRYVVIAGTSDRFWLAITELMGRKEWGEQEKFKGSAERAYVGDEVNSAIDEWLQSVDNLDETIDALLEKEVPVSKPYTFADLYNEEQFKMRDNLIAVEDPVLGRFEAVKAPMHFSRTEVSDGAPAPLVGADTEQVLRDIAGLPVEAIQEILKTDKN